MTWCLAPGSFLVHDERMDSVVDLLQALVRTPSVNPDNSPGTESTGESLMVAFLADFLESHGATVHTDEILPGRENLIARFVPMDGRPRVLFGPHSDTVGVGGMIIAPFGGELRDGKLWGRGASDTKGPMSAMLWALLEERDRLADLPVAVDFVCFMGEESSQWGSRHFARNYAADYSFAVVGEPTSMQVVNVTKGSMWATLAAQGRAAHSSMPELGENAILKMARDVLVLDRVLKSELMAFTHPVLGHSTLNLGVIRGGSRPNVVPDESEIEIDIRLTPSLHAVGGAEALLRKVIAEHVPGLSIIRIHENTPMETSPGHSMVRSLIEAGANGCAGAPWFSDAAHLAAAGIPSICIGPGSIQQAHTADEFIRIDELQAAVRVFRKWIRLLGNAD